MSSSGGRDDVVASSSYVDSKGRFVGEDGFTLVGRTSGRSNDEEISGNHIDAFIDYDTVEFSTATSVHLLPHTLEMSDDSLKRNYLNNIIGC